MIHDDGVSVVGMSHAKVSPLCFMMLIMTQLSEASSTYVCPKLSEEVVHAAQLELRAFRRMLRLKAGESVDAGDAEQ